MVPQQVRAERKPCPFTFIFVVSTFNTSAMTKPRGKRGGKSSFSRGGHAQRGRGQKRYDEARPSSALGQAERPESAVDVEGSEGGSGSDSG